MLKPKLVLTYVVLVGLPLLGLLGVLRAGRKLTAPVAVGGAWNLEADFTPLSGTPCGALLSGRKQPSLNISQSGTSVRFSIGDPVENGIPGTLQNSTLTMGTMGGESPESSVRSGVSCEDSQALYLKATVHPEGGKRVMTGTLGIHGCANCSPVSFRAVRVISHAGGSH